MKIKKIVSTAITSILISTSFAAGFDAETKSKISGGLVDFSKELLFAVPEASTQQNVWSDAYIGNLYPSLFPHLGVGLTIGGTYLDTSGFKTAVETLYGDQNFLSTTLTGSDNGDKYTKDILEKLKIGEIPQKFVLPTATIDFRLGGIVLPFDIGICAMMTNPSLFKVDFKNPSTIADMSQGLTFNMFGGFKGFIDYLTIGGDLRYRFFEGSTFIPTISLGGGYYFTRGNFKVGSNSSMEISDGTAKGNQITNMDVAVGFQTQVIFAQLQISKDLNIASFFLGGRGILSNTTTTWAWNYDTHNEKLSGFDASDNDSGYLTAKDSYDEFKKGIWDFSKIQPQIYGGFSINIVKVQLTFGACCDIRSFFDKANYQDYIWSGSFSTHYKF